MLVCSVSQRGRRVHAAAIAESVIALDAPASAPLSIIAEAASAADTLAAAIVGAPATIAAAIDEAATADSVQDATVVSAIALATLDGVAVNATLSNGNLTATHSTTTTNSGARSTSVKSSGKYYFEFTYGATNGNFDSCGILLSTGAYSDVMSGQNCTATYVAGSGQIFSNDGFAGAIGYAIVAGTTVGVAIDLTARKAWFRNPNGLWNNNVSYDPATNVGGYTIEAGSFAPFVGFGGSPAGNVGDNITANFGQSAFAQAAPSGFGNWPA